MNVSVVNFSAGTATEEKVLKTLRAASWVVVGAYGVALCYRFGLFRRILSKDKVSLIENVVEKIKARTEPLGNLERYATARRHLIRVYTLSSLGMLFATAGGAAFFLFPKIPIVFPTALAIVPTVLIFCLPKDMVINAGRVASMFTACFAFGYSFGPIGWVAWDSIGVAVALLASTMAGLSVPLFLTRGMVSYVLSSQLLSCALSLAVVTTAPLLTRSNTTISCSLSSCSLLVKNNNGLDILRRADINVFLTLQLFSNWGINLLHTLPTICYFLRWNGSEEALLRAVDPVKEGICICAGAAYVLWRSFHWACSQIILSFDDKKKRKTLNDDVNDKQKDMMSLFFNSRRAGGVGASLILIVWYVKAVSSLQRGDTVKTLEALRSICARISPISLLVTSN